MKRITVNFCDLPILSCFEFGGELFEKQDRRLARNIHGRFLVFFQDDYEVFEKIPDAWKDGNPVFIESETEKK